VKSLHQINVVRLVRNISGDVTAQPSFADSFIASLEEGDVFNKGTELVSGVVMTFRINIGVEEGDCITKKKKKNLILQDP